MIWRALLIGAIAGVLILFLVYVGFEVACDWRRGRKVRKFLGDAQLADQAVEDLQLQAELDELVMERGLVQHRKMYPSDWKLKVVP